MTSAKPVRRQTDLAEMVEMLLDKGVVVNADITVSIGQTELLGIKLRAAIASFDTAAKYGLEFPEGTNRERLDAAAGVPAVADEDQRQLAEELDIGLESGDDDDN